MYKLSDKVTKAASKLTILW